ncbi:hypothetical protein [Fangia hongkongensis]|uniref:hypothetical protein n=1 Tax=Fangia hongkongensis TaxID=270495 RepID=UPI0003741E82|nr:hypothetical protein [Fangia hongkongensis]MBK2125746.1 hypothetical protein [Fangia hongkongensis]
MGLLTGAIQLATMASKANEMLDGYAQVRKRLSASEEVEAKYAVADFDTVVIVAKPSEAEAYRAFFDEKKLWLKKMVSSGYNERAFDVAVKMGSQVSQSEFEKVQEKLSFGQKVKIRLSDWFLGKNAYITDIFNPRMLKNILTFNYENIESENVKLIAKVLESLYHEYVSYYEWLAMNEDAKKMTQEDGEQLYSGCFYSQEKKLWIIYDDKLWKTAVITSHLIKILCAPGVNCHNDKMAVSGSFGSANIVPIALYHIHFLNEFLQQEYRKPQDDEEVAKRREKLATQATKVVQKLTEGQTKKGSLVKAMAKYAQGTQSKITDTEVANLVNIKALQLIQESLKSSQENSSGTLANLKEGEVVQKFKQQLESSTSDINEAHSAHMASINAIHQLQESAKNCDVFVDSASLGNLFGILKNNRQTVISSYFKLYDFQGHLRVFQDYVIAVESFAQKSLPSDQVALSLSDRSLEYVVKNMPFHLSTLIFPNYPAIDSGIFITSCKEKYFQQMFSSSFAFLMVDEDKLNQGELEKVNGVITKLKAIKVKCVFANSKLTLTHDGESISQAVPALEVIYTDQTVEKNLTVNKTVANLLVCFKTTTEDAFGLWVQKYPVALEAVKGYLREIEAAVLANEKVITFDASKDYRKACYGQMTAFINEFVFGINQSHIKQVSDLTMQMFSASYPEQMPFLHHMFRTRMGLLNQFSKFSSYDMVVHWQLAHSMLYFSTQDLYEKEGGHSRGDIGDGELKTKLADYLKNGSIFRKQDQSEGSKYVKDRAIFSDEKEALVDQIANLRADEQDLRFLISLCVAAMMTEYDRLVELYLVQQALRQVVGLYGEEFIKTESFKTIINNFDEVLKETYENVEDIARAQAKSVELWKEALRNDATRVKVHTNSYQAARKILKLQERLSVFQELVAATNVQVKKIEDVSEPPAITGYIALCDVVKKDVNNPQLYAPQLESETLVEFHDQSVLKAQDTLKEKRFKQFKDSMENYLDAGITVLKELRAKQDDTPDATSFVFEDEISRITAMMYNPETLPYSFTVAQGGAVGTLTTSQKVLGLFNGDDKAYTYMQLVLSAQDSSLKNEMNFRQLIDFVLIKDDCVNLYQLFQKLNEEVLKTKTAGGSIPIYQGNELDQILDERVSRELDGNLAVYCKLCNSGKSYYLSEYITKFMALVGAKSITVSDSTLPYFTTAAEIMHTLLGLYAKVAINLDFAMSRPNFVKKDGCALTTWKDKVFKALAMQKLSDEELPRYEALAKIYKQDDLKPSLVLMSMLSQTNEMQRSKVAELMNYRTGIQLTVAGKLKDTQEEYLESILKLAGESAGYTKFTGDNKMFSSIKKRGDNDPIALITRKTTSGGLRTSPLFYDVLPSFKETSGNYQLLNKYAGNSGYLDVEDQLLSNNSTLEVEKFRLLRGKMSDSKTKRTLLVKSFGGFDQTYSNYLGAFNPTTPAERATQKAVKDVFSGGEAQYMLTKAYLILDDSKVLQGEITSYQSNGQFSLALSKTETVATGKIDQQNNPNTVAFYPTRAYKTVDVD